MFGGYDCCLSKHQTKRSFRFYANTPAKEKEKKEQLGCCKKRVWHVYTKRKERFDGEKALIFNPLVPVSRIPFRLDLFLADSLAESAATTLALSTVAVLGAVDSRELGRVLGTSRGGSRGSRYHGSGRDNGRASRGDYRRGRCRGRGRRGGRLLNRGGGVVVGASPGAGTGHWVVLHSSPDAEVEWLIVLLVCAGELVGGARSAVATVGDLDLQAAFVMLALMFTQLAREGEIERKYLPVVELGLTIVGTVDSNVLGADKVLAVRGGGRDSELNPVLVPGAPGLVQDVLGLVAHAFLVDLEPFAIALVLLNTARSQAHVDMSGARMLHGSIDTETHGQLGAGLDLKDLCGAGTFESAQVAAEVVVVRGEVVEGVLPLGGHVRNWAIVLADVLRGLANLLAIDVALVEEVMGRGDLRNGGSGEDGELHLVLGVGVAC